jgi:hypothetical protein
MCHSIYSSRRGARSEIKNVNQSCRNRKTKAWDGVAGFTNPKTRKMKDKKSNFQFEIPAEGYLDIRIRYYPDPGKRKKQPRRHGFFWLFSLVRVVAEIGRVFF